jgi:hypothetical protein
VITIIEAPQDSKPTDIPAIILRAGPPLDA